MKYAIETNKFDYGIECILLTESKKDAEIVLAAVAKLDCGQVWMREVEDLYATVYGIHEDSLHTTILATFDNYICAKNWYSAQKHYTYNYGDDPAIRRSAYLAERSPGYHNSYSVFHTGTPLYGFKEGSIGTSEYKHENHNPSIDKVGWQLKGRFEVEEHIQNIEDERKVFYWMSRIMNALSDDLLKPGHTSHCYIASEALYYLTNKTLHPKTKKINGTTYWWLENEPNKYGAVYRYDITRSQFKGFWVDYRGARGRGFLTKEPSKRAQILINRAIQGTYKCNQ